jgi:chemosensory pili system protein ChpA (sensor histidine kinase/response regulator)
MTCAEIISRLRQKYHGKEYDVTTPKGMKEAIDARAELRAARLALDKEKPKVKEEARKFLDSVEKEYKAIHGAISEYEDIPDEAIKAEVARKEAEKEAEKKREEERRSTILENMNRISAIPTTAIGLTSLEIQTLIEKTVALPITGTDFQEFLSKAESIRNDTLRQLRDMLTKTAEQEIMAANLKAQMEKIEAEKIEREKRESAEREEKQKQIDADAARLKAEREKFEAEQAERDRINKEAADKLQAEREAFEAQQAEANRIAKEKADKEAAELAEAQRIEDDRRAAEQQAAEDKAAEEGRIAAEKAEAEKAEADRIEQEKRDADAAALRAEFDEKVKNINYAMGYIFQLTQEPTLDPWETIKKISDIAGKFITQEGSNALHESVKPAAKRVQSTGKK